MVNSPNSSFSAFQGRVTIVLQCIDTNERPLFVRARTYPYWVVLYKIPYTNCETKVFLMKRF